MNRAFPTQVSSREGMTLREYYAGQALAGFYANPAAFAANSRSGWALVNCSESQLIDYCNVLADTLIAASKGNI